MRVGLVGYVSTGKSTLFHLLTGSAPDPGKAHQGQLGMATLTDPRLEFLTQLHKPKKVTAAQVEFFDTPGLIPGSSDDNPQRLALIRNSDALLIVLNGFDSDAPADELHRFREELQFADLSVLTNRVERLEASVKKHRPGWEEQEQELAVCLKVRDALENGQRVDELDLTEEQKKPMRSFGLLTDKPQVIVLNTTQDRDVGAKLAEVAPDHLVIDAKLELELSQLDDEERAAFMEDLGFHEFGKDRIITGAYAAAGIITFFTAGEPEVRGWNLEVGSNAVEAAGKIHTDIARGFIRAEVTAFNDLKTAGSVKEAKAQNLQRLEGKEYIVQDGDVIFFRSNA